MDHALKEKLRSAIEAGDVKFASSDFEDTEAKTSKPEDVKGDVVAQVPKVAQTDPLLEAAGASADTAEAAQYGLASLTELSDEVTTITDDDRRAFIQAIVSGGRFVRPFSLFGGTVSGEFRCRSTQESEAIGAWLNKGIREQKYKSNMEYMADVRNSALAAHVSLLNGVKYAELAAPYTYVAGQDGTVSEPAWLKQAEAWGTKPLALVLALHDALKEFEKKYWTMVFHAKDQDFWQPVTPT